MGKDKIAKTNVARLLDKDKIHYELVPYEVDENDLSCIHVAKTLGENIEQVFKTLVLHGDGTDMALLREENVGSMDAFIAVTGDEETNILSCLLARSLNIPETVVRVNKAAYLPLIETLGIGHSVSPRLSAVNSILQYIRYGKILSSVLNFS